MSIDDRIRRELEQQGSEIDRAGFDEKSLFGMLGRVFTGSLRRWAAFGMLLTLAFVALTVWCGYGFFTATDTGDRVFWGVLALAAVHAVSMLKLWFFMEMNRNSVIREVKRMEIALNRLER
jgi:hypothetical protein